jgi:hypothetical protein
MHDYKSSNRFEKRKGRRIFLALLSNFQGDIGMKAELTHAMGERT